MGSPSKDGEGPTKGTASQSWLRDLWNQKHFPLGRMGSGTMPVFFDRDWRVGPSALWWSHEPHAFGTLTTEDGRQEAEEAELARAAQAALEIAQVRSTIWRKDL